MSEVLKSATHILCYVIHDFVQTMGGGHKQLWQDFFKYISHNVWYE